MQVGDATGQRVFGVVEPFTVASMLGFSCAMCCSTSRFYGLVIVLVLVLVLGLELGLGSESELGLGLGLGLFVRHVLLNENVKFRAWLLRLRFRLRLKFRNSALG